MRKLLNILFIAWIAVWLSFLVRELVVKGGLGYYKKFIGLTIDEKYDLLIDKDKARSEDGSVDKMRLRYLLYPKHESEESE